MVVIGSAIALADGWQPKSITGGSEIIYALHTKKKVHSVWWWGKLFWGRK
jgi:hypothetical protein